MTGFLDRAGTAAWLTVTPQKFKALRESGELAALGFPAPTFGTRNGERWDPEHLKLWRLSLIPAHLRALAAAIAGETPAEDPEAKAAAILDERAAALGRRGMH